MASESRIVALLDPSASTAVAQRATRLLRDRLGGELVVVPVAIDHDVTAATRCAMETFGPRAVIAIGGDAMIGGVAAALVDSEAALGIVPVTGEMRLARQLGLPTELEAACAAIADVCDDGEPLRIDVLTVGDRIVLSRTVVGRLGELDAPPGPETSLADRIRWGARSLSRLLGPTARYELEVDGRPIAMRASSIVVANSGAVGLGGLRWAREIAIDDGCVDVVVIRSSTIFDYASLLASWALGRPRPRQAIRVRASERIAIKCSRTVPLSHDGARARGDGLAMSVVPGGLRLLAHPSDELGAHAITERPSVSLPVGLVPARAS